jgi:hypothetical protein
MRTRKQIEASRRNGARSRGPSTAEGKARAALNATRHGLSSRVVGNESAETCDSLLQSCIEHWHPATAAERDGTGLQAETRFLQNEPGGEQSLPRQPFA